MIGLLLFLFLIFVLLPIGFGILVYKLLRRSKRPKWAKYFAIGYFSILIFGFINLLFEDELFTKAEAKNLIEEQQIFLRSDFTLRENKSMTAIGDYYHTFTLEISENDKEQAIIKIKSSENYKTQGEKIVDYPYEAVNSYSGPKQTQNYETKDSFVREYFQPNGKGYAPTFRRISINKIKNELKFEDIDD